MRQPVSPWVARGLYLFGLVLVFSPMADVLSTVWPPRPMDLPWRYSTLGVVAGYLQTPMLGVVLLVLTAHWRGHGWVLRAVGGVGLALSVALLIAMVVFGFAVLQMVSVRPAEVRNAILVSGAIQEAKYLAGSLSLAAFGAGALATARSHRGRYGDDERSPGILRRGRG